MEIRMAQLQNYKNLTVQKSININHRSGQGAHGNSEGAAVIHNLGGACVQFQSVSKRKLLLTIRHKKLNL